MTDVFVGLDIEATGAKWPKPGERPAYQVYQLCQIGVALPNGDTYTAIVGYDEITEDPEAMAVHGITREQILAAPRANVVDAELHEWLLRHLGDGPKAIPVGWSVGSFDMPYVREVLPLSARHISARSVDLNAVVYTLMQVTGRSYNALKSASKKYAEKTLEHRCFDPKPRWHSADFDAAAALAAWEFFQKLLVMREIHDFL